MPDRAVVVTGATGGLGRSIALTLSEDYPTAIHYRSQQSAADNLVSSITAKGGTAMAVAADVTDEHHVDRLFATVEDQLGAPTILVNCAGALDKGLAVRTSAGSWEEVLAANLRSTFLCSRRALRSMVTDGWGRIVNISSVSGLRGVAGQASYAAAKAGVIGFSRSIAVEYARHGITCNVVAPGFVPTAMTEGLDQTQRDHLIEAVPMRRAGTAEEVAFAVRFFAAEGASYITGQIVAVDGGATA